MSSRARYGSSSGLVRGDSVPARRQRGDDLRLRLGDVLNGPEQLEVDRPDPGDHSDLRARQRAELRDLPEPAHAHLADDDLCVLFDAAQGQR